METLKLNKREKGCFLFILSIIAFMFLIALLPMGHMPRSAQSAALQQSRSIGLALFQYAQDHSGKYPEGKSSTEVFQKLLDGAYISNPTLFYVPMHGKIEADSNTKKLNPENNCWDVTCCLDAQSPDGIPLVFLTGYKITYKAGTSAIPLTPLNANMTRSWSDWWHNVQYPVGGIAACYKNNSAEFVRAATDGSVPNFIPADFDPKGKTYRQLTPDGELPP
jgi:hypothetical protein